MPKASSLVLATDREIKAATSTSARTDYRIRGASHLQLRVTPKGSKTWTFVYKSPLTGKWAKAAIGTYPAIGLAEAKDCAQELAVGVRKGKDPLHDKRRESLLDSFQVLSERYMLEHAQRNSREGRRSRSTDEAQRILDHDILPKLGPIRAELLRRHHVMEVVEAVAERGSFVASDRVLGLVRAIFSWACGSGRLEHDPTLGLKRRSASRPKTRVLTLVEISKFWEAIDEMPGMSAGIRDALRLQLVTAARINEIVEAARSEIDWTEKLWIIPASRTKSRREHRLPLSEVALSILRDIIARCDLEDERRARRAGTAYTPSQWIFPSQRSVSSSSRRKEPLRRQRRTLETLEPHAATRCVVRCREDFRKAGIKDPFNTHDLRRTVATHLGEMGVADEIIERLLNHAPRTVAGKHYNHAKYLPEMRDALVGWSKKLAAITDSHRHEASETSEKSAPIL